MCDLCDSDIDIKKIAQIRTKHQSDMFKKMGRLYDGFANGSIDPHGKEIHEHRVIAKMLVKELVEWI